MAIKDAIATAEPQGVAEYSQFVTYRLSQLNAKLSAQAARVLRAECDLSVVQWRILALIGASSPITSAELVRAVAMDAGLFSRNLKSLIADGLVLSKMNPNDTRQQLLRLSRRGLNQFNKAAPVMQRRREQLVSGIKQKDLDTFFKVLDCLEQQASVATHD